MGLNHTRVQTPHILHTGRVEHGLNSQETADIWQGQSKQDSRILKRHKLSQKILIFLL